MPKKHFTRFATAAAAAFCVWFALTIAVGEAAAQEAWRQHDVSTRQSICRLQFLDENVGVALTCNSGWPQLILRTEDGGENWTDYPINTSFDIKTMYFSSRDSGTVGGQGGRLLHTTDGGRTWTARQIYPTDRWLLALHALNDSTAIIGAGNGMLLRTSTGIFEEYSYWEPITMGHRRPVFDFHFWNDTDGLFVGDLMVIYLTSDGGYTWESVMSRPGGPPLHSVDFADSTLGLAVGGRGNRCRTTDAARSWQCVEGTDSDGSRQMLWKVKFVNRSTAFTAGHRGGVFRTDDAGLTWIREDINAPGGMGAIAVAGDRVFIGGDGGFVVSKRIVSSVDSDAPPIPATPGLVVFPNPTAGRATVTFSLDRPSSVSLAVYDLLGRRIAQLREGDVPAGRHSVDWDSGSPVAGLYMVRLSTASGEWLRSFVVAP